MVPARNLKQIQNNFVISKYQPMQKIAIPMVDCNLCDHFEEFQYFLIYDFENPACIREDLKYPPYAEKGKLTEWLIENGVTDIIARGIDYKTIKQLSHKKIHVFVGVQKKDPEDLIKDYLRKNLYTDEQMCYHS
jgi:predicted Fe-Mo cluster-binding NifX family protein